MLKKSHNYFGFEKNTRFAERVLFLSFPTALIFMVLAAFNMIDPVLAIVSLALVVMFNIAMLFPLSFELQQIRKYINKISKGELSSDDLINLSENETKELITAINNMHRFWAKKTDILETQTISDTAVLDSLPDPILVIDKVGNILGANLSARTSFGEKITENNIENIFTSHSFINAVSKVLRKESTSENLVFYVEKPLNQKLYAHIKQLPWISKGKAVAVIAIYDLTKSFKIEKMQSDFVANASHELRTPLSVISGFVETLRTTAKDDPAACESFLKIIATQAEYMSGLIENLLSLSKIELNQDNPPTDKVDLLKAANDVIEFMSMKATENNMQIVLVANDDISLVRGDEHQIKQIMQNLIGNAIKYGLTGTAITLTLENSENIPSSKTMEIEETKSVKISVNNKGPKIEAGKLARLTERFYRLQQHKDQNIKGTGLGLSIVKHIVMRHKGNLIINSSTGKGTTFSAYIPVWKE